jgi:hypothetical protein
MFFFIQFSSMMIGWIGVKIFAPKILRQGVVSALYLFQLHCIYARMLPSFLSVA